METQSFGFPAAGGVVIDPAAVGMYAGNMQITININNDQTPSVSIDKMVIGSPEPDPVPNVRSGYGPMSDDQRSALFGAWRRAFPNVPGNASRFARIEFTRSALGLSGTAPVSWSRDGSLTAQQASHLIQLLDTFADLTLI